MIHWVEACPKRRRHALSLTWDPILTKLFVMGLKGGVKRPVSPRKMLGFTRAQLTALFLVFFGVALFIWYSVNTHPAITATVDPLNNGRPMNVLVAVKGTPLDPGFVGFVAEIRPNTQVLRFIPIPGRLSVSTHQTRQPLFLATSDAKPLKAVALVSRAAHMPINSYFLISDTSLIKVLDALYYHSPHWPTHQTPLTMLQTMGYPGNRIHPHREMELVQEMIERFPLISPLAAGPLLSIPETSVTNLRYYQLFLLATYLRGNQLREGTLHLHTPRRESHG